MLGFRFHKHVMQHLHHQLNRWIVTSRVKWDVLPTRTQAQVYWKWREGAIDVSTCLIMRLNELCKRCLLLQNWKSRIQFWKSACTFVTRTLIKGTIIVAFNVRKMIGWYGIFTMICQKSTTISKEWYQNFSMYFMSILRVFSEFHVWGVIACFTKGERWILSEIWIHMIRKYEFIFII